MWLALIRYLRFTTITESIPLLLILFHRVDTSVTDIISLSRYLCYWYYFTESIPLLLILFHWVDTFVTDIISLSRYLCYWYYFTESIPLLLILFHWVVFRHWHGLFGIYLVCDCCLSSNFSIISWREQVTFR